MSAAAALPRSGPEHWLRGYRHMLAFEVASSRQLLGFMLAIQLLLGAGMAVLYGFYLPVIPPRLGAFIATGTPALALIPVGFVSLPSVIANRKLDHSYDYVRTLPVPRSASIAATATVFTLLVLPGAAVALALASWRYGVTLQISPMIVPAVLLTSLVATSAGAAIGHGVSDPMITALLGNLIIFLALLFTPVVFPPSQYPTWLVSVHGALPFYNMAIVLRAALSVGLVTNVARAYAVLGAWALAALAFAAWVVSRRR